MLAAGAGSRLRPLTDLRPKPLCPVGDRPLIDHALERLELISRSVAVNVHHGADQLGEHLERRAVATGSPVHISLEPDGPLGTAGALGKLRRWLDGRDVVVVNADTWHLADLAGFVAGWDHARVAVLSTTPGPLGPASSVVASALPGRLAADLPEWPSGLWETLWSREAAAGRLRTVHTDALALDCGTPPRYLGANLAWARLVGGCAPGSSWVGEDARVPGRAEGSVVGAGAVVAGVAERCLVWPGSTVEAGEHLSDAIRAEHLTVLSR